MSVHEQGPTMTAADFEDHCWKDIVPADVLALYAHYRREVFVGPRPALLAIDLYNMAYRGGPGPLADVTRDYPAAFGSRGWEAVPPTIRLFDAARAAGIPVIYTTGDVRPGAKSSAVKATNRRMTATFDDDYEIFHEFTPEPGDIVIRKQRASAFYGTPLLAHLTQLNVQSLIVCGESTSGCVRASAVDAYSSGYHVTLAEECCFDRSDLSHKVNLFDLHHKYADVMKIDEVLRSLERLGASR